MTANNAADRTPRTKLQWWLRGSATRRMFARALGGGNDAYLSMATKMLDAVAREVAEKPWADPTEAAAQAQADEAVRLLRELVAEVGSDPITEAAHLVPLRSRLAAWIKARAFLARLDGDMPHVCRELTDDEAAAEEATWD